MLTLSYSLDISAFISKLPQGRDTSCFRLVGAAGGSSPDMTPSSGDASGSTSQAANIVEALEMGATTLLVDEDTCATNFMMRDGRMARLVETEPITPFLHRVRGLLQVGSLAHTSTPAAGEGSEHHPGGRQLWGLL